MRSIYSFVNQLNAELDLDARLVVKKKNRYFLLTESMKSIPQDFFYVGMYLGKTKDDVFFPSFNLLTIMDKQHANRVVVDEKTEWLFICGRDVFRRGIVEVVGSGRKGNHTLVMNQRGECLGFGKIIQNIGESKNGREIIVKNISDVGDFLRREK